ncbi:MAG: hypothetical protein L0387_24880, partial [Acidobacteria bacterium]|nr:hypothetical protein [Acidobacteriota bacterium]
MSVTAHSNNAKDVLCVSFAWTPLEEYLTATNSTLVRRFDFTLQQGMTYVADTDPEAALGSLQAAACTYRIALGPRAGQKVLS